MLSYAVWLFCLSHEAILKAEVMGNIADIDFVRIGVDVINRVSVICVYAVHRFFSLLVSYLQDAFFRTIRHGLSTSVCLILYM